jgi:hypothetical protein
LVNSFGGLLVGSVPETAHGVFKVLLNWVGVRDAVADIGHAVEIEGADEEALNEASNLNIVVSIISLSDDSNESCSESSLKHLIESFKLL